MSMYNETPIINQSNVDHVRKQILKKQNFCPFFATAKDSVSVLTDYDSFPYNRWYRGVYYSDKPIVAEREAGYRPLHNDCYNVNRCSAPEDNYPKHCFQFPCSVIFPCSVDNAYESSGLAPSNKCISLYR